MKKITLLLSGLSFIIGANAQTFSDSFEADSLGFLGPQSDHWTTWSNNDGGEEDVLVVNTDNHTSGGSKSIHFFSTDSNGGPTDCVLPFDSIPLTTGKFSFTSWFKIPTGKTAYFNFQGAKTMGQIFALECVLDELGEITIRSNSKEVLSTTHPFDAWFKLTIEVNLNINKWTLLIDDVAKGQWKNPYNQVFAIDYYPTDETAEFWVDDVSYTITPYVLPAVNGAANAVNVPIGLAGQTRKLAFTAFNLGQAPITSFDVSVSQNGAAPVKETISGLNIPSYGKQVVTLNNSFTIAADSNKFLAIISNVNGAGVDGDPVDDTTTSVTIGTVPAAGKVLFAEGLTGTWCQYCPRTAVFTDFMMKNYAGYYAPVSVHADKDTVVKDTMTLKGYSDYLAIPTFPRILSDRAFIVDPRNIEASFISRITTAPEGVLVNGAEYDPATRKLKVSITTTFKQNITGDYRVACVLTEDSVSGVSTAFDQVNGYAGGALGEMGGYELLPNPVPAASMNYNYVARAFSPAFEGYPNAYGASASTGQIITHNFSYTLPASWDANQIHIIGVMLDPSGSASNASYTTIKEAVKNGFIPGIVVGINQIAEAPDAIKLAPNPVGDLSYISMNLKAESSVSIDIYNVNGALVASKNYGKLSGAYRLPVDAQMLTKGLYLVRVNINNQPTVLKLIKE